MSLHQLFGTPLSQLIFLIMFSFGSTSSNIFLCVHCFLLCSTTFVAICSKSILIISSKSNELVPLLTMRNCLNEVLHRRSKFSFCELLGSYSKRTKAALNRGLTIVCHISLRASAVAFSKYR